ncbi:16208_t:CDS:2 [Racocetra persica]|uniref:16208_t:CDS:1 n=1 Tax=Racocetra persica TaxID=160502 RepID=A0ACA9NXN3_9GLOM|nr:16208_t:CDS:2 [Racocetra persica]
MASKEELKKRKTYLQIAGFACSNCHKTSREDGTSSLLRCTRCRMSYYCSKSCQKADFLFHKQFCAAIEELSNLEEVWYSCNGKESEWNKRKIYHMQLLVAALDRDLTSYESNAWLNQPKCHRALGTTPIEAQIFMSNLSNYGSMRNNEGTSETLWAPEEWDEGLIYPPLPKDWSSYWKWRKAPPQFNQLDAVRRVITNSLSLPLTILSALERFYSRSQLRSFDGLVIHLIGAGKYEVSALMSFEEIMHILPNIRTLQLILIGIELSSKTMGVSLQCCPRCTKADRKRIYSLHPISYHEYSASDDFITPQIVVGFNIGLYDEFWKPSVEFLIEKELPCIFTSYSKDEANQDAKMLKTLGAKIIVSANENKWRSTMPLVEPQETDKFYYNNYYRTLLKGRRE